MKSRGNYNGFGIYLFQLSQLTLNRALDRQRCTAWTDKVSVESADPQSRTLV